MQTYIVSFAVLLCLGISTRLIHPASSPLAADNPFLIASIFILVASVLSFLYRVRSLSFILFVGALCLFFTALPLNNTFNYYFIWVFAGLVGLSIVLGFLKIKSLVPWVLSALFLGYGITCIFKDISSPTHLYHWATDEWGEQSLIYGTIVKEPEIRPELNRTDLTVKPTVVAHLKAPGTRGKIAGILEILLSLGREWSNEEEALRVLLETRDEIAAHPEKEKSQIIKRNFSTSSYQLTQEDAETVQIALEEIETGGDSGGKEWISLISEGWILAKVKDTEEQAQTYIDISYFTAYGDAVKIRGSLRAPYPASNPGAWNAREFYSNTNYFALMTITGKGSRDRLPDTIEIIQARRGNFFIAACLNIKYKLLDVIRQTTPFPDSGFLSGIFLGLRRGVPEKIMQDSRAAGTAHVFAVSGLHVTIITGLLLLIFNQTPIPKSIWAPIAVLFLLIFTIITGARPSTLRAAIMNSFVLIFFTYFGKNIEKSLIMAISVAAIIILTIIPSGYGGPLILPSASFLMSFSAVLFLGLLSRPVEHYLNLRINNLFRFAVLAFGAIVVGLLCMNLENPVAIFRAKLFWGFLIALPATYFIQQVIPFRPRFSAIPSRWLRTFIAAQIAIQCSIIPLSAVIFHRISLAAPFANFIGIPLIGIILPLGMIATLLGFIPFIGIYLAILLTAANWLGMHFFIIMDDFFARYFPYPQVPKPGAAAMIAFYALVGAFIYREKIILNLKIAYLRVKNSLGEGPSRLRAGVVLASLLIAVGTLTMGFTSISKPLLTMTFIDLSWPARGMSLLIQAPDGNNILIDGGFEGKWGYQNRYVNQGERGLQEVLLTKKVISFDAVINTNFDSTLLGGLAFIVGSPDYYIKELYTYLPPSEFGPQDLSLSRFGRALTPAGKARVKELYQLLLLNDWVNPVAVEDFKKFYRKVSAEKLRDFLQTLESEARLAAEKVIAELDEKEEQQWEELLESIISTYEKLGAPVSREKAEELAKKWDLPLLPLEVYRDFITDLPQPVQWFVYQEAGLVDSLEKIEVYRIDLYDKFEKAAREAKKIFRGEEKFIKYHRLMFYVKEKNIPLAEAHAGINIIKPVKVGGIKLSVTIVNPPKKRYQGNYVSDSNSTVIRVEYGDVSVLLTSMINQKASEWLLNMKGGIRSTVYQVPEFGKGGRFISTSRMLDAINPEVAVFHYKPGKYIDKRFQEVWDLCQEKGIQCYNTSKLGALTLTTDGESYQIDSMLKGEEAEIDEETEAPSKAQEVGVGF